MVNTRYNLFSGACCLYVPAEPIQKKQIDRNFDLNQGYEELEKCCT